MTAGLRHGDEPLELACDLDVFDAGAAAAHRRAFVAWQASVTATRELDDGFEFDLGPAALADVAAFIGYEQRCCAFLTFNLHLAPGGPLTFRLSGPPGTKATLEAARAALVGGGGSSPGPVVGS